MKKQLIIVNMSTPYGGLEAARPLLSSKTLVIAPKSMHDYLSEQLPECKVINEHELRKTHDKAHLYKNIDSVFVYRPPFASQSAAARALYLLARAGGKSIIFTSSEIHNESHWLSLARLSKSHKVCVVSADTMQKDPAATLKAIDIMRSVRAKMLQKVEVFKQISEAKKGAAK